MGAQDRRRVAEVDNCWQVGVMSDSSELLLELIEKAQAVAERERRPTVAYLLSLAADATINEKPLAPTKQTETHSFSRRQWRWSARGRFLR